MNNERRKRISKVVAQLYDISGELFALYQEEEEAFDSMPENLRTSEKGEMSQEAVSTLEDSASQIDDIISNLEDIIG